MSAQDYWERAFLLDQSYLMKGAAIVLMKRELKASKGWGAGTWKKAVFPANALKVAKPIALLTIVRVDNGETGDL